MGPFPVDRHPQCVIRTRQNWPHATELTGKPHSLDALLGHIIRLRDAGNRLRYDEDHDYRWALRRVWIAIGNEALAFAEARGLDPRRDEPWARLYLQRNLLAHRRLPEIDEDRVWRHTTLRADEYQPRCGRS